VHVQQLNESPIDPVLLEAPGKVTVAAHPHQVGADGVIPVELEQQKFKAVPDGALLATGA
jgi:hypothetical protein